MPKTIVIRDVPEELRRKLAARAAERGMSLSDYLIAELRRRAAAPTDAELAERIRNLPPVEPGH